MESDDTDEYRAFLKAFGLNLRCLRTARDPLISQERLALDTGLHRTAVGKIERGIVEPRLTTLMVLAKRLCIGLDELVAGLEAPNERKPRSGRRPPAH
jgi:transcriptional regulator with XRE-family HTH domain